MTNAQLAERCLTAQGFDRPPAPTLEGDPSRLELWPRLLDEEVEELRAAIADQNLVEVADALADILYVAYQAAANFGLPIDRVFAEVHRSNMTKVHPDGTVDRRPDGKIQKPATFEPPHLAPILFPGLDLESDPR